MLLRVCDLKTYFRTREGPARAVEGVSFDINEGETFCLVGESGCGKSVTALSVIQLVPQPPGYHAGGSIEYKGQDLLRLPESEKRQLRGSEIGMIFQEPMTSLNPVLTVGFQLMEPLLRHRRLNRSEAREKAIDLLGQVNIPDPAQRFGEYPHQLSGGMKQRVMIAMAMTCEPGLLIADEPTTALDVTIQAQILNLLEKLQARLGLTYLFITHNLGVVEYLADEVAVMYLGRIVERGKAEEIFGNPCHPYTQALLSAVPQVDPNTGVEKIRLSGDTPSPIHPPTGCHFHPRCRYIMTRCRNLYPPDYPISDSHSARCYLYDPDKDFVGAIKRSEVNSP